ncbi:hypothetical protein KGQ96_14130 [Halomonas coralii]|nr:hypothetical protein [Modicisalibacter sp. R2A 31.J]MBZ9576644.1 hypothetical protein [Modicisalibacter sp. MOD 31.J]
MVAAVVLGGCGGSPLREPAPAPPPPPMSQTGEDACGASALADWQGREYRETLQARAAALSGASEVRVMRPGQGYTMDYRPQRLDLHLDASGRITRVDCG